jgi:hypothetical protein
MNVESLISFITRANWIVLGGLIALLGAAFVVCFSERDNGVFPSDPSPQKQNRTM